MDTIIAYRSSVGGSRGKVEVVMAPDGREVAVFDHEDAAIDYIHENPFFRRPGVASQIVVLDEL